MKQARLEEAVGHRFSRPELLRQALTHRSYGSPHNERLEFLGDSVLNCITATQLYERYPALKEGELSRLRANLVRQESLAQLAQTLSLGDYLHLGERELKSGGFRRPSILADGLEAIFGAIYLDAGFDAAQAVIERLYQPLLEQVDPKASHLNRLFRQLPNAPLQFLLADSVRLILTELAAHGVLLIECISLDTKHVIAWAKENNPKAYVKDRYDQTKPPKSDPDCRLGCKRRHNQSRSESTPTRKPIAASRAKVGEFYWGYGSGIIVTKVPRWGEFVLAELTQPFDHGDVSYFFPLMAQVEQRLGYTPRFGTFDAAFDAWYVYAHFYCENDPAGGFAAVPFSGKGGYSEHGRQFDPTTKRLSGL